MEKNTHLGAKIIDLKNLSVLHNNTNVLEKLLLKIASDVFTQNLVTYATLSAKVYLNLFVNDMKSSSQKSNKHFRLIFKHLGNWYWLMGVG